MRFTTATKVFSKDELYIYAEIISIEGHIPLEDITRSLENFFSDTGEDQVRVVYPVPIEDDLPYMDEMVKRLEATLDGMEYLSVKDIQRDIRLRCRESWHTHHKEGKPCKAKIQPQYWHRIRSFCVRNNYH